MTATIEQLQKIVNDESRSTNERKQAAEHILKLQGQRSALDEIAEQLPDDDPDVLSILERSNWYVRLGGSEFSLTLAQAKREAAEDKHRRNLRATAGNESLPLEQRIDAARQWRATLSHWNYWDQFPLEEMPERLATSPHLEKMRELARIAKDQQATVKARFAAMDAYRQFRDEFPKREEPADGLSLLDWGYTDCMGINLAHQVGEAVAVKTGESSTYIAGIVRGNRGADFDVPLAELASAAPHTPRPEPDTPRMELTPEQITRYFDQKLAELDAAQRG